MLDAARAAAREHWQHSLRTVVLDTDFQQGQNFIALWQAFQADSGNTVRPIRCKRLHVMAMLTQALTRDQLLSENGHADCSALLAQAWPSLTPGFHKLSFDGDSVQLLLCIGNAERPDGKILSEFLSDLVAEVNVFFVHGQDTFPSWPAGAERQREREGSQTERLESGSANALRMAKALARLAAKDAVLLSDVGSVRRQDAATSAWRAALTSQGFAIEASVSATEALRARFTPRFIPKRAAARVQHRANSPGHAVIVGAGLAGSSAAWALAQQGWTSTVFERHSGAAQEASGNAGGLFHGVVHAQDGLHARFNRAASIEAAKAVRHAVARHGVAGAADGLLRLEASLSPRAMQAVLDGCGLPADHAKAITAAAASQLSGLTLTHAAWHYLEGGWVQPAGLVRSYLARAGSHCALHTDSAVASLRHFERHGEEGRKQSWQLLNERGEVMAEADVVVLANAHDAARLLRPLAPTALAALQPVRGQISQMSSDAPGLPNTLLPLTGAGYLLPSWQGQTLFGATSNEGDTDPSVRPRDHADNLAQLAKLTQMPAVANLTAAPLQGRTAWRCVAPDRLPVIGGVPEETQPMLGPRPTPSDQPRLIARWPGLFVYTALGSRGITWSALGAQVLAAWVTGSPSPIEASLLDAVDPARFAARRARAQRKV